MPLAAHLTGQRCTKVRPAHQLAEPMASQDMLLKIRSYLWRFDKVWQVSLLQHEL